MPDKDAEHWDNYWQGRASKQSGNALVEVGIETNHALKKFWIETFSQRDTSEKIIDFACGAGSVLEHAFGLGFTNLTGVDVSQEALNVMKDKIPPALGICSRVDDVAEDSNSYDFAVSQYGVEYAGDREQLFQTLKEMHRVLKPGGGITIIAHAKDGLIYKGCETSLENAERVENSQFITVAKRVISILYDNGSRTKDADLKEQMTQLNQAAEPITRWLSTSDQDRDQFAKFAYYILQSSHRLITQFGAYSKADTLAWFSGIEAEIDAYKGRMLSMTKAALTETEISDLSERLSRETKDLTFSAAEGFHFTPDGNLAAWVIKASKH